MQLGAAGKFQDAPGVGGVDAAAGKDDQMRPALQLPQHVRPFLGRWRLPRGKDAVEPHPLDGLQGFKRLSADIESPVEGQRRRPGLRHGQQFLDDGLVHVSLLVQGAQHQAIGPQRQCCLGIGRHPGNLFRRIAEIALAGTDEDMDFEVREQVAGFAEVFPQRGEAVQVQPGAQFHALRAAFDGRLYAVQITAANFQDHFHFNVCTQI